MMQSTGHFESICHSVQRYARASMTMVTPTDTLLSNDFLVAEDRLQLVGIYIAADSDYRSQGIQRVKNFQTRNVPCVMI